MSKEYTFKVNGFDIFFPNGKKPFPAQYALISKVLQALKSKKNALLESPTGTGKSLALLTSSLSWQKGFFELKKNSKSRDIETNMNIEDENKDEDDFQNQNIPKIQIPKIFFCSRTHSQLDQIVAELKNYNLENPSTELKYCLLGSRSQYCINERAKQEAENSNKSLDEYCKELSNETNRFKQDKGNGNLKFCHFSFQDKVSQAHRVLSEKVIWDIEDAQTIGRKHRGCPYYSSRAAFKGANYILAPYNYILEPTIRELMSIDISNSVIIFDEAHNIEDVARDSASTEIKTSTLQNALKVLKLFSKYDSIGIKALYKFLYDLNEWISIISSDASYFSEAHSPNKSFSSRNNSADNAHAFFREEDIWDGDEILDIFEEKINVNLDSLKILEEYLATATAKDTMDEILEKLNENNFSTLDLQNTQASQEKKMDLQYEETSKSDVTLPSYVVILLKGIFNTLNLMLKKNRMNSKFFKASLVKSRPNKPNKFRQSDHIETQFNIWCLSGSVIFKDLADSCLSTILTSGTLSPLDSFAGELGTQFDVRVETQHVIDVNKQLMARAISSCNNVSLNSTYLCQNSVEYQDAVGQSLRAVSKVTPGGVLMFLPSYSLLSKLEQRWIQSGLIDSIENDIGATVVFEPKDAKSLSDCLDKYYDSIASASGKAVMVAVCRGKVSEGINFSDNFARAVLIVGIPFPSISDKKILCKKHFQTIRCNKEDPTIHIDGDKWYQQQAYRAVNQALGRCIRHKNDYGVILLLDPRYQNEKVVENLSKWIRRSVQNCDRIEDSILDIDKFFKYNGANNSCNSKVSQSARKLFTTKLNHVDDPLKSEPGNRKIFQDKNVSTSLGSSTPKPSTASTIASFFSKASSNYIVSPIKKAKKQLFSIQDLFDEQVLSELTSFCSKVSLVKRTLSSKFSEPNLVKNTSDSSFDTSLTLLPSELVKISQFFEEIDDVLDSSYGISNEKKVHEVLFLKSINDYVFHFTSIKEEEEWCSSDGVVYRKYAVPLVHLDSLSSPDVQPGKTITMIVKILAVTEPLTHLLGYYIVHKSLLNLVPKIPQAFDVQNTKGPNSFIRVGFDQKLEDFACESMINSLPSTQTLSDEEINA